MWLLAIEWNPPPTKSLSLNLVVKDVALMPKCKCLVILMKDFNYKFDCDDDDDHKYPMAVEHELCIVYPEQSLRAPLHSGLCIVDSA